MVPLDAANFISDAMSGYGSKKYRNGHLCVSGLQLLATTVWPWVENLTKMSGPDGITGVTNLAGVARRRYSLFVKTNGDCHPTTVHAGINFHRHFLHFSLCFTPHSSTIIPITHTYQNPFFHYQSAQGGGGIQSSPYLTFDSLELGSWNAVCI